MNSIVYDKTNSKTLSELKKKYESEISTMLTKKSYDIYSETGIIVDFSSIDRCVSVEKNDLGVVENKYGWAVNIKFNF